MRSGVLIWALSFALLFGAPAAVAAPDEDEMKAIEVLSEILNHWEPTRSIDELRLFNQPGFEALFAFQRTNESALTLILRAMITVHAEGKFTESQQVRAVNFAGACLWEKSDLAKPALIQFLSRSKFKSVRLLAIEALHNVYDIDDDYTQRATNQGSINFLRGAYYQEVSADVRTELLKKLKSYGATPKVIVSQVSAPQHPPEPKGLAKLGAWCGGLVFRKSNKACFVKDY